MNQGYTKRTSWEKNDNELTAIMNNRVVIEQTCLFKDIVQINVECYNTQIYEL